jgi:L-iditol 2-dehydrogenase
VTLCNNKKVKGVSVNGAFAEYVTMPYTHIFKIPQGISFPEAALCEPLACACNGVQTLDLRLGDFVVIFGPGSIGLMQMQMIKALGAGKIAMVGIFDFGLKKALSLGADYVFNTQDITSPYYCADLFAEISRLTNGDMANRVIVPTSAKPALQGALRVSGKKSKVVFFGLPSDTEILEVPLLDTMTKDKSILVSWQAPFTWVTAQKAMREGFVKIETLISHTFTLENLEEGLQLMDDPLKPDKIKSVVVLN